ncbi:uncharacterized mitochondrial protein AtMg00310-like [Humulus lupulus]|uniref:uncharacterized mitochondrial protein AtMg00310-like n=1 Tax=Humulus lupulus TaxID=3486 RepID=UPI002B410848|nr:uncharacterized mitochondrial protein AtMg00310-like [Humulus lupulus]
MNLFRLSVALINEIHRLCARFWWGLDNEKRRMHWCTWDGLCWHKADGGLGFRNLSLFNQSLLAKQAWRIHNDPNSLAVKVVKGIYFANTFLAKAKMSKRACVFVKKYDVES